MATQFVKATRNGRRTRRQVANRFFGGWARGTVVEWNVTGLSDDTRLVGTDGSRVTVAELRQQEGQGKR